VLGQRADVAHAEIDRLAHACDGGVFTRGPDRMRIVVAAVEGRAQVLATDGLALARLVHGSAAPGREPSPARSAARGRS
jgi:hypothetical protein